MGVTAEAPADPGSAARAPKRLLWVAGGVLVLLALTLVSLGAWRGHVQWQRFRAAAAVVQAELDAREPSRPVLWGDASPGPAWPHYERAFTLLSATADGAHLAYLGRVAGRRLDGVAGTEPARKGPTADDAVAAHVAALAALRAGTHATDGRRPMTWSAGFGHPIQNLLVARQVANAAVLAAILAAGEGDGEQSVHLLLDVAQLGRDLAQSPLLVEQMIGCAVIAIGTGNAIEWSNLLRHLDAAALRTLAAGLATLDATLPLESGWLASEAVLLSHHPVDAKGGYASMLAGQAWDTWRYGFSSRLAVANHGLHQLQLARRVQALGAGRDAVDLAAFERLFADTAASPNPATRMLTPNLGAAMKTRLSAIATLRMLRMAVQHAAGEMVTPLPDPSGGKLQWALDADGHAEFWSDALPKLPRVRVLK